MVRSVAACGHLPADLAEHGAGGVQLPAAVVLGCADASLADLDAVVDALAAVC